MLQLCLRHRLRFWTGIGILIALDIAHSTSATAEQAELLLAQILQPAIEALRELLPLRAGCQKSWLVGHIEIVVGVHLGMQEIERKMVDSGA